MLSQFVIINEFAFHQSILFLLLSGRFLSSEVFHVSGIGKSANLCFEDSFGPVRRGFNKAVFINGIVDMPERLFSSLNLLLDNVEGTNLLLEYLSNFNKCLHEARDFKSILNILNDELRQIYAKQKIEIILWQDNDRIVKFKFDMQSHEEGSTTSIIPSEEIISRDSLYQHILKERQTILTNSYIPFCENINVDTLNLAAHSWLGIPMVVGKKVLGALVIWDDNPEHYLRLQDKLFLSTIADRVSAALENIYLHDYLAERKSSIKVFDAVSHQQAPINSVDNAISQLLEMTIKQENILYAGLFTKSTKSDQWDVFREKYKTTSQVNFGIGLKEFLPEMPDRIFDDGRCIFWSDRFPGSLMNQNIQKHFHDFKMKSALFFPYRLNQIHPCVGILGFSTNAERSVEEIHLFELIFYIIRQLMGKESSPDKRNKYETYIKHLEKMKEMGELASGAIHHLNNIMSAIIGKSQLLRNKLEGTPSTRDLDLILRAAEDGANSIQKLQRIISQDQTPLEFKPLAINEIIQQVVEIARPRYKSDAQLKGIHYELELNLGNVTQVMGDATSLREVILNLINNGLDAMPEGGKLAIQTTQQKEKVLIFVRDTGVGIREDIQTEIFEPFFSTKGENGTGLGLSIAANIIKQHKGRIHVDSVLNRGSIFMIELPAAGQPISPQTKPTPQKNRFNYKILLVDDEGIVRETFGEMLTEKGCEVTTASNAREALLKFRKLDYDIIFTDLNMPGTNGIDLAKEFKKINANIPVFIITGWNSLRNSNKEENGIVDGVIRKPFNIEKIMSEIRRVVMH